MVASSRVLLLTHTRLCAVAKVDYLTRLFEVGWGNGHGAWIAPAMPTLVVSEVVVVDDICSYSTGAHAYSSW